MTGDGLPVVSFVIPVKNDARRLEHCLKSIRATLYPASRVEIVVIDNGSTDDSAAVARAFDARVLSLPKMRLGALRNRGAAASTGTILAFVDADHEISAGWIDGAVAGLGDEQVGAIGAACWPPVPGTWVQQAYDLLRSHSERQQQIEWLGSGNMAVRRSAFDAAGGFDTSLETCEDVDLCRKLRARGFTILGDPRLHNIHFGDPQTLRHVFFGELWRGRDNVRVSLRPPRAWRTVLSAVIPMASLAATGVVVVGLASASTTGRVLAALAAGSLALLVTLRALRMIVGKGPGHPFAAAVAVAGAYELGRALALAVRVRYGRRRQETASG